MVPFSGPARISATASMPWLGLMRPRLFRQAHGAVRRAEALRREGIEQDAVVALEGDVALWPLLRVAACRAQFPRNRVRCHCRERLAVMTENGSERHVLQAP